MDTYEKKYKEALGWMQSLYSSLHGAILEDAEHYFPELKESDERIRKEMIEVIRKEAKEFPSSIIAENASSWIAWLEKQGEKKLPIEKLPSETKTIGKSLGFTTQEDCDRYNQMVSDLIMSDDDKGEQKPADKAEPKFKVGNWITNGIETVQITGYDIDYGYQVDYKGNLQHRDTDIIEKEYHLWNIADAKDGDALVYVTDKKDLWIMIYLSLYEPYEGHVHYHALLVNDNFSDKGTCCICIDNLKPATKEQRDLLFQKMKEASYEWDAEKKELRKIDNEEIDGEDYGIDGLWHAQRILEKTLGSVDGYQTDDGILEHKAAITAVKKLYGQKPAWSEEDETGWTNTMIMIKEAASNHYTEDSIKLVVDWLKSLKGRVQPQPKQEWSEEDEEHVESILKRLDGMCKKGVTFTETRFAVNQDMDWLKSLEHRMHWKPTKEQMDALWRRIAEIKISDEMPSDIYILGELHEQLENL